MRHPMSRMGYYSRGGIIGPREPNLIESRLLAALTACVPEAWRVEWRHGYVWVFPDVGDSCQLAGTVDIAGREDRVAARFVSALVEKIGCCDQGRLLIAPLPCPWHPPKETP